MAYLKRAVVAGFKNIEHMNNDKDLDALRGREEFKKLMAELEAERKMVTKEDKPPKAKQKKK